MKIARQRNKRNTNQKGNSDNLWSISWLLQPNNLPSLPYLEDPGIHFHASYTSLPASVQSFCLKILWEKCIIYSVLWSQNLFLGNHKVHESTQFYTQLLRISVYLPYQSTYERWLGLCPPVQPVSSEITLRPLFVIIGHLQEWKSAYVINCQIYF